MVQNLRQHPLPIFQAHPFCLISIRKYKIYFYGLFINFFIYIYTLYHYFNSLSYLLPSKTLRDHLNFKISRIVFIFHFQPINI